MLGADHVDPAEPVIHCRRRDVHFVRNLLLRNANLARTSPQSFDHRPEIYGNESKPSSNLSLACLPLEAPVSEEKREKRRTRTRMPEKGLTPEQEQFNRNVLRFVRPWMRFRKLSQRVIAERMDVSEATVSKWLNGRQTITIAQFSTLCRILTASPEDVLCGTPQDMHDGGLMRRLAELSQSLTDEQLRAMIAVGEQFLHKKS